MRRIRGSLFVPLALVSLCCARRAAGQGPFVPGGRDIISMTFASTPVGEMPTQLKLLMGTLDVVMKNGIPMLRASAESEFLIPLPEVLPQNFTLEFDLVPKACCNPADLMIEGTPTMNRGVGSAQLVWDTDGLAVVGGGGGMYQTQMPEDFKASLPGVMTRVEVSVERSTIKLYTNGRRLFTLDRQFVRGRVLRVYLGGQDDDKHAVYLARLRVAAGTGAAGIAAGIPPVGTPRPGVPGPGSGAAGASTLPPAAPPITPTSNSGLASGMPTGPAAAAGPVTTAGSTARNAARCAAGAPTGAPPLNYQAGGGRVGGGVLEWWVETNAEYLVERSPDPGDGGRSWTRLTSTCDVPNGMNHFMRLHEDGQSYPAISLIDAYPGVQLGAQYVYRVTVIRPDGTSGSSEAPHIASDGVFLSRPIAAVNGNSVTIAADVSYCTTPAIRCDPWMMEFVVTSSSVGYQYSSRQTWVNTYDPSLPPSVPGGVDGTFAFTIPGLPSGTHTFTLTALYSPNFRVAAGAVTVRLP